MSVLYQQYKSFITFIGVLALWLATVACSPDRIRQTDALRQEMADMKIKRIGNADMVETVDRYGERIGAAIQKELSTKIQQTTALNEWKALCQLQNLPRLAAIEKHYGVSIQLLSGADVQNESLNPKERAVLDAYLYNAEQKLPQLSNIQKISDTLFVYNAAVPTSNVICQVCFGEQKTPLAVWRIVFPKREVIRRTAGMKK